MTAMKKWKTKTVTNVLYRMSQTKHLPEQSSSWQGSPTQHSPSWWKELMTRLQELRKSAHGGKKAEESSMEVGSVGPQEMIAKSVAKVVKREVEKSLAEVREDMPKVWKEVQEQKKKETPTPAAAAA
jgi:hypothetical protein